MHDQHLALLAGHPIDNPSGLPPQKLEFIPISLYKKFQFEMLVGPGSNRGSKSEISP